MIYTQAGRPTVKQAIGPKHTNTSGELKTWFFVPDASTWPNNNPSRTHTHTPNR